MLTGQQLFTGETVSHVLADVLRAPIDFDRLPKETPRANPGFATAVPRPRRKEPLARYRRGAGGHRGSDQAARRKRSKRRPSRAGACAAGPGSQPRWFASSRRQPSPSCISARSRPNNAPCDSRFLRLRNRAIINFLAFSGRALPRLQRPRRRPHPVVGSSARFARRPGSFREPTTHNSYRSGLRTAIYRIHRQKRLRRLACHRALPQSPWARIRINLPVRRPERYELCVVGSRKDPGVERIEADDEPTTGCGLLRGR